MITVVGDEGFQVAFAVAAVGSLVAWWLIRHGSFVVGAALVAVVAALSALRWVYDLDARLAIGLALLALPCLLRRFGTWPRAVAALVGAFLVIGDLDGLARWMQVAGFVAIVVAVPLSTSLDRAVPRWMPLLVLASVVGVYIGAPDTEVTKLVLGALVPVVALPLVPGVRANAATASLAGLVVWLAVLEGRGRPGAVVGSIACLGVILVAPLVRWRASALRPALLLLATQVSLVLYAARVAGLHDSALAALAWCVPAFVAAFVVLALVNRHAEGLTSRT